MKKAKICIGTSNFGKLYGHNQDKFNKRDISKLFDYLKVNNLPYLDTAESYGNIGLFENKIKNFKLIYKINFKKKKNFKEIFNKINNTLKKLKLAKFEAILIHDVKNISSTRLLSIVAFLEKIKKAKLVKYIGASIYDEIDLKKIFYMKRKIDLIQLPLNIFDRTFIKNKLILKMRKRGIKFHARSIFLQGILLKDKKSLPKYFLKWIMLFDKWEDWHKKNRQKKIVSCINFVSKIKFIDKIIVGINNLEQLKQIIKIKESKYPINIYSKDQKLLKPYLWKLRKYEK